MSSGANAKVWNNRVRAAFWIVGILFGVVMAYTTRYFINGDAIVYIEMGEAFRNGDWAGLVNFTYSPGYPLLLAIAQAILDTNPVNELQYLRVVNFFCFLLAMVACEFVMRFVRSDLERLAQAGEHPLPLPLMSALCYSMFLVCTLVFIRIRLLNPDMLVFTIVLACAGIILWIRQQPKKYFTHAILGATMGVGYLVKSFFFPFAPILLAVAGFCCESFRKAIPRVGLAVLVMAVVSAPLIGSLSSKLGRFSYGELGRHIYAKFISGKGEPIYPQILEEKPRTTGYVSEMACTRPAGFDICYWHEGLEPDINFYAHVKVIPANIRDIFEQTPWLLVILVWFALQWRQGSIRPGPLRPPSLFLVLIAPAVLGTAFYALVRMEPRYIAPYLFLGFVSLTVVLRYDPSSDKPRRRTFLPAALLTSFFLLLLTHSLVDQGLRGLRSSGTSESYRDAFNEHLALKDFLRERGLKAGDYVGLVGSPPVYWGRMARLKIVGEIEDEEDYLNSSRDERTAAAQALKRTGIKALVAKGQRFETLKSEGWRRAPGTRDYYVVFLQPRPGELSQGRTSTN